VRCGDGKSSQIRVWFCPPIKDWKAERRNKLGLTEAFSLERRLVMLTWAVKAEVFPSDVNLVRGTRERGSESFVREYCW